MKELLKNKSIIGFMILVVTISYMNGVNEKKVEQEENFEESTEIVYNTINSL